MSLAPVGGPGPGMQRRKSQQPHQPAHPLAIHADSMPVQNSVPQPSRTLERVLKIDLINKPHQFLILPRQLPRAIIDA